MSLLNLEFLRRGGITVAPALRGGNEYGHQWHQQAILEKKPATFEDLIATARMLSSEGWTSRNKVISTGGSNGGLTVAAAALLAPDAFGLVIPHAGVLDMLAKDFLDKRFEGWKEEYGDCNSEIDKQFLLRESPLELVQNQGELKFLIMDGILDTRVNPAHSLKFAAALEDFGGSPQNVLLNTLKNAGHFESSEGYQNLIGWRWNVVVWTTIADFLSW